MRTSERSSFEVDLSDPYAVLHIIGDINDHLLDEGRDDDAADFLLQAKGLKVTSPDDWSVEDLLSIASEYVDIYDVSDSRAPMVGMAEEWLQHIEEQEDDEPLSGNMSFDEEHDAVNKALALPVNLEVPEYPDLWMTWDFEIDLADNMLEAMRTLFDAGEHKALRQFVHDWRGLRSACWTYKAMFQLAWSYVKIYPHPDQYGTDDW